MNPPIGLVAGWGRFPVLLAESARARGQSVTCVGLRHEATPELEGMVDQFHWSGVTHLGKIIRCLKKAGVQKVAWAGKIHKFRVMYRPWRILTVLPDWRAFRAWMRQRKDNRDDTMLLALVEEFQKDGLEIVSALDICPELIVSKGVLTKRSLSRREEEDADFGWDLAREMGRLDVGQSVMIRDRNVLAVEAIEGTDQAILRAGGLCRMGDFVVVKVAKPNQDMRFDVPTIGKQTLETMKEAGARALVIEAEKTIILDQEETVEYANRHGMSIVAR